MRIGFPAANFLSPVHGGWRVRNMSDPTHDPSAGQWQARNNDSLARNRSMGGIALDGVVAGFRHRGGGRQSAPAAVMCRLFGMAQQKSARGSVSLPLSWLNNIGRITTRCQRLFPGGATEFQIARSPARLESFGGDIPTALA